MGKDCWPGDGTAEYQRPIGARRDVPSHPPRTPRPGSSFVMAGLLTCGSMLLRSFPAAACTAFQWIVRSRSPPTVAGAVVDLLKRIAPERTTFPFHPMAASCGLLGTIIAGGIWPMSESSTQMFARTHLPASIGEPLRRAVYRSRRSHRYGHLW